MIVSLVAPAQQVLGDHGASKRRGARDASGNFLYRPGSPRDLLLTAALRLVIGQRRHELYRRGAPRPPARSLGPGGRGRHWRSRRLQDSRSSGDVPPRPRRGLGESRPGPASASPRTRHPRRSTGVCSAVRLKFSGVAGSAPRPCFASGSGTGRLARSGRTVTSP